MGFNTGPGIQVNEQTRLVEEEVIGLDVEARKRQRCDEAMHGELDSEGARHATTGSVDKDLQMGTVLSEMDCTATDQTVLAKLAVQASQPL
ncbi:hypothetical protein ACET3Z_000479 [Daucus carota]